MNTANKMRNIVNKAISKNQKKYIESLYAEIEKEAKRGRRIIDTLDTTDICEWFTLDFFESLLGIFIKDGFNVERKDNKNGSTRSWWRISW